MFKKNNLITVVVVLAISLLSWNLVAFADDDWPVAAFSTEPADEFVVGEEIKFIDESTPAGAIDLWVWIFGDNATSDLQNPVYAYKSAGVYTVALQVFDENGFPSDLATKDLKVGERFGDTMIYVSGTYGDYKAAKMLDGNTDGESGYEGTWASVVVPDTPKWVEFHYDEAKTFNTVTIYWPFNSYQGYWITSQQIDIQILKDGEWVTVASMLNDGEAEVSSITFDKVTADKVRFYQPGDKSWPTYQILWIAEIIVE